MGVANRIIRTNIIGDAAVSVTSLDEQSGFPSQWVKDQLSSKRYRSNVGWTFGPGFNDVVMYGSTADSGRIAYLSTGAALGVYATGSSAAAAIQTALNAGGINIRSLAPTVWYRSDAVLLDSSNNVQTLYDLSTGGNNATQASSSLRPAWIANAANGRPGIYFNDTALMGLTTTGAVSTMLGASGLGTVVVVFYSDSDATSPDQFVGTISGTNLFGFRWNGGLNYQSLMTDTTTTLRTATLAAATGLANWHHGWWMYDSSTTTLSCFVDDADTAAAATATSTGMHSSLLATTFRVAAVGSYPVKGYILEIIVFNTALSEGSRQKVAQYLAQRYRSIADTSTAPPWNNTYAVTYNSSNKFNVSASSGSGFTLQITTSGNYITQDFQASAGYDLGFTADKSSATTQTGDQAVYQSRHWVRADLTTSNSTTSWTSAAIIGHNLTTGATVTLKDNTLDLWTTGGSSRNLTTTSIRSDIRFDYMSTGAANRFWRIEINDVTSTAGYSEFGVWHLGSYFQPARGYESTLDPGYEDLTERNYGSFGAVHVDEKSQRDTWQLSWSNLSTSDYDSFVSIRRTTPIGRCFLFAFDASSDATNLRYVELATPIHTPHTRSRNQYRAEMTLREALG
jgi:hypothetical protein